MFVNQSLVSNRQTWMCVECTTPWHAIGHLNSLVCICRRAHAHTHTRTHTHTHTHTHNVTPTRTRTHNHLPSLKIDCSLFYIMFLYCTYYSICYVNVCQPVFSIKSSNLNVCWMYYSLTCYRTLELTCVYMQTRTRTHTRTHTHTHNVTPMRTCTRTHNHLPSLKIDCSLFYIMFL